MDWGEHEDALLRQWRAEGFSFTQVELKFHAAGYRDVTRGALIGRADRRGIDGPPRKPIVKRPIHVPLRSCSSPSGRKEPAAARATLTNRDAAAGPFLALSVLEIDLDQCRYPEGEPARFCGQPTLDGSSYCPFHHRLCHHTVNMSARGLTMGWLP